MTLSPYELMQSAVDIVGASAHPTNKIAAALAGTRKDGKSFHVTANNFWPDAIRETIGTDTKIGNSSGTVHAETACILKAPVTDNAGLFITDPPCPNCMKNMAEAGVKALYIDHKGFDKDWATRHGEHFDHMSMKIAEHAGINVYEVRRKEEKLAPILEVPEGYAPAVENPLSISAWEEDVSLPSLLSYVKLKKGDYGDAPFALALARGVAGEAYVLAAQPHPAIGYTTKTLEEPEGKYSFILEPVNRLLMASARYGLKIDPDTLYCSRVPTSRELVNMIGANLTRIHISNPRACRDEWGLKALEQLQGAGILKIQTTDEHR